MRSPEQNIYILDRFRGKKKKEQQATVEQEQRLAQREAQGRELASEIAMLRQSAASKEDYELLSSKLRQLERLFTKPESMELQEAREVLGNDVFGPEKVKAVFGIEMDETPVPEIPYSRQDLEKAKELGEILVLRVNQDPEGQPLTMQKMNEMLQAKFQADGKGKILWQVDWYANEDFFTKDTPKVEWKLISKDVVPNSTSKNYIEQTRTLRDYLREHGLVTEEELAECSDEKLQQIREFLEIDPNNNWKETARQLSELQVNKNHRRIPAEALYDGLLVFGSSNERLLEHRYDWTATTSSDGGLVYFGDADARGAGVRRDGPRISGGNLGVVSVR